MTALLGQNIRHDHRLNHPSVVHFSEVVRTLNEKLLNDPDWFFKTHHWRLTVPSLGVSSLTNGKHLWNVNNEIKFSSELIDEINPILTSITTDSTVIPENNMSETVDINQENNISANQPDDSGIVLSIVNDIPEIINNKEISEIIDSQMISETVNAVIKDAVAAYCSISVSPLLSVSVSSESLINLNNEAKSHKKEALQHYNTKKDSTNSSITLSSISVNDEAEEIWQNEVADSGVFTNTFDETEHLEKSSYHSREILNENTKTQIPIIINREISTKLPNEFNYHNKINNVCENTKLIYDQIQNNNNDNNKKILNGKAKPKRNRKQTQKQYQVGTPVENNKLNKYNYKNNNENEDSCLIPDKNLKSLVDQHS